MATTIKRKVIIEGVTALAEELGITPQHLSAVLKGRRRPGPALLEKLRLRGIKPRRLTSLSRQWV